jgi:hypothetical protein
MLKLVALIEAIRCLQNYDPHILVLKIPTSINHSSRKILSNMTFRSSGIIIYELLYDQSFEVFKKNFSCYLLKKGKKTNG